MKAKPMTTAEFAEYAAAVPKDRQEQFNAMLAFIEGVVTEKFARILENNIMEGENLTPAQLSFNSIWRFQAKKIRQSIDES